MPLQVFRTASAYLGCPTLSPLRPAPVSTRVLGGFLVTPLHKWVTVHYTSPLTSLPPFIELPPATNYHHQIIDLTFSLSLLSLLFVLHPSTKGSWSSGVSVCLSLSLFSLPLFGKCCTSSSWWEEQVTRPLFEIPGNSKSWPLFRILGVFVLKFCGSHAWSL